MVTPGELAALTGGIHHSCTALRYQQAALTAQHEAATSSSVKGREQGGCRRTGQQVDCPTDSGSPIEAENFSPNVIADP